MCVRKKEQCALCPFSNTFSVVQFTMPVEAQTGATRFRLEQFEYSGSSSDIWALESIALGLDETVECAGVCLNGGTCVPRSLTHFDCICVDWMTGATCADLQPPPSCGSSPRENGGTCVQESNAVHSCACLSGFTGVHCATVVSPPSLCLSLPCLHGGTCFDDTVDSYECQCESGRTGANCESVVDMCASSPCEQGSTCTPQFDTYTCTCIPQRTGEHCESGLDACASSPCDSVGVASCFNGGVLYECLC